MIQLSAKLFPMRQACITNGLPLYILPLIEDIGETISMIIVDGFVTLRADESKGARHTPL
jgi:hypothetical protein